MYVCGGCFRKATLTVTGVVTSGERRRELGLGIKENFNFIGNKIFF